VRAWLDVKDFVVIFMFFVFGTMCSRDSGKGGCAVPASNVLSLVIPRESNVVHLWRAAAGLVLMLYCAPAGAMCFEEAGRTYNISPQLLRTIARVESRFNPRAIHYNRNGSYDFGIMQINSSWAPTLGKSLWNSLGDPCTNVQTGAWILAQSISRHGYCWKAIGYYNARDPVKRAQYIRKIRTFLVKEGK
jgi:hypothetical protein